jgi:hypothetical protein
MPSTKKGKRGKQRREQRGHGSSREQQTMSMSEILGNISAVASSSRRHPLSPTASVAMTSRGGGGGREAGNAKFRIGDLPGAVIAYEACLSDPNEDRLPVLSNLGLCHAKMGQTESAIARLTEALDMTRSLFANAELAVKAAFRLYEAIDDGDGSDATAMKKKRRALYDLRYYARRNGGNAMGIRAKMPSPVSEGAVFDAALILANSPQNDRGLGAVESALIGVPPEACDQHGNCLLNVAIEMACRSPGRGPQSYGCKLIASMLDGGTPPDVRDFRGATPLMYAANTGRSDLCEILLDAGASLTSTDERDFRPLHCACAGMEGMYGRVEEYEAVFALLLTRGASPNVVNAEGMTPLMYCGQRLHGRLADATGIAEMLLAAGADLTTRTNCEPVHGYSVVDYAILHGSETPIMALLRQTAEARGSGAVAWMIEAEKIQRWIAFTNNHITPAHNAGMEALAAAGVPCFTGTRESPAQKAAAILQECGKAEAIVGVHGGLEDAFDVVHNPLLKAFNGLMSASPTVMIKRWTRQNEVSDWECGEIQMLWGTHQQGQILAESTAHVNHMHQSFFVGRKLHQDWLQHSQCPLQHTYACSIPSEAAIDALVALQTPLLELGAGAGYWGALLRMRGVECVLYDRAPPTAEGNNPFFSRQYTIVLEGDERKASLHPDHTLMMVWPFSEEEAEAGMPDSDQWDVRALRLYAGSTVVHVGELQLDAYNCTTSSAFKHELASTFMQVQCIKLPSWPNCSDELTIWKRRS